MPPKTHRRRVVICGSCALTLLAIELLVRRLQPALRAFDIALYRRVADGLRAADKPDIVLMGSSRAAYGLDPTVFDQILCRKTFNAAVAGSKTVEWNVQARRLFEQVKPRLVVLGINAGEVRYDYAPTEAARNLFNFDDLVDSFHTDGFSLDVVGAYARRAFGPLCATYDLRYELRMWGQERLSSFLPKHAQLARELRQLAAHPLPPNGYDHPWRRGRCLKNLMQKVMEDRLAVWEANPPKHQPDASSFVRLENLFDWFEHHGIRVLVVYIPNSPRTEARWIAVEPRMTARIAQVCRTKGVPFLHWDQKQLPRSDRDYFEETHVGWPLAREISSRVAEKIQTLALLDGADVESQIASAEVDP